MPFFHNLWSLLRPYWTSEDRWRAVALLAAAIASDVGLIWVGVGFNTTSGATFNAIQDHNLDAFLRQLAIWGGLFVILLFLVVSGYYFTQLLCLRWRRWMTRRLMDDWMDRQRYYRLQLDHAGTDNPDQRIAEDVGLFVAQSADLFLGLIHAVLGIGAFGAILWRLSENFDIFGVAVPGPLLWAAVLYSLIGSLLTHAFGRKLSGLNFRQQRYEADFRFSLVRIRENAQSIALLAGEEQEKIRLQTAFEHVIGNWRDIISREKHIVLLKRAFGQMSGNVAYLLMAPRYFAGGLPLGALVQAQQAFVQIDVSLNWFIQNYRDLAVWRAAVNRLAGFQQSLAKIDAEGGAARHTGLAPAVCAERLRLRLPDGRVLSEDLSLRFPKGSRTLVSGPSGCGKSTLFSALAGIWPHGEGVVTLPDGARLLFLPQRPYLPIAALRDAVVFPDSPDRHRDQDIAAALRRCGLDSLTARLDEKAHWGQRLSPGEQQRLAFARALLIRPDYLFLDEASSALDEASETALYQLLLDELPGAAVVSIAHRASVGRFHPCRVDLATPLSDPL